jgi:DNA-binding CsgD family transcriptional regulator
MSLSLSASQRSGHEALPPVLPVGRSIVESLTRRFLDEVPSTLHLPLLTLAIAGGSANPAAISALLDETTREALRSEPAVERLLNTDDLSFLHPLVQSTVWEASDPADRRAVHAAIARAIRGDVEAYAVHLAAGGGPPEEQREAFLAAADAAGARGALIAAARFLEQAGETTPDVTGRLDHWIEAAMLHLLYGDVRVGRDLLIRSERYAPAGAQRARIRLHRLMGELYDNGFDSHLDTLRRLRDELGGDLPAMSTLASLVLAHGLAEDGQFAQTATEIEAATAVLGAAADTGERELALRTVWEIGARGSGQAIATPTLDVALGIATQMLALREPPHPERVATTGDPSMIWTFAAGVALADERWDLADVVLDGLIGWNRLVGWYGPVAETAVLRCEQLWRSGRWIDANRLADETDQLNRSRSTPGRRAWILAARSRFAAADGDDAALDMADEADHLNATLGLRSVDAWTSLARATLFRERGELDRALRQYERLVELSEQSPIHPGWLWWRHDHAETLARAGRADEALAVADRLIADAQRLALPVCEALGLRARALTLDRAVGIGELTTVIAMLEQSPAAYELARSLCIHAELAHHADPNGAHRSLICAAELFDGLRAIRLRDRALADAARLGGRTGRLALLSDQERRVVAAAASGLSNKQIAAALGISAKTVEFHLTRAFRRLGVATRAELIRLYLAETASRWDETPSTRFAVGS